SSSSAASEMYKRQSLLFAFTLGAMGEAGRSVIPYIQQASSSNLMSAILAWIIFNISNILLVASINLAGMAGAFSAGGGLAPVSF
ncbi:hypothetical protein QMO31_32695, partial [Pseudomonas aeruginosa]